MAYLQTFTNTSTSVEELALTVDRILGLHNFRAISLGTRPDCLGEEVIEYLQQLNNRLDVWLELGVQTSHDSTLELINRGHDWQCSRDAILRLERAGLNIAAHCIFGLPGETNNHFDTTVERLNELPVHALKFHNLHIIKNTVLAKLYETQPFPLLSEHQYCDVLLYLLPKVLANRPIIRLTTDTEQNQLIAPQWSMSKGQFRSFLFKQIRF
jgi:radical SAM protein (TIGR01212 family)